MATFHVVHLNQDGREVVTAILADTFRQDAHWVTFHRNGDRPLLGDSVALFPASRVRRVEKLLGETPDWAKAPVRKKTCICGTELK